MAVYFIQSVSVFFSLRFPACNHDEGHYKIKNIPALLLKNVYRKIPVIIL